MQAVLVALDEEAAGQGPPKRPHVPGLVDAALVPLQTLMHQCWHQVNTKHWVLSVLDLFTFLLYVKAYKLKTLVKHHSFQPVHALGCDRVLNTATDCSNSSLHKALVKCTNTAVAHLPHIHNSKVCL